MFSGNTGNSVKEDRTPISHSGRWTKGMLDVALSLLELASELPQLFLQLSELSFHVSEVFHCT